MITLNLSQKQYDVIKNALVHYADHMSDMIEAYLAAAQKQTPPVVADSPWRTHDDAAPWGLKKDGTPRARPGRKSTKKARKAQA